MPVASKQSLYSTLPSVDELLRAPELSALLQEEGQAAVVEGVRAVLAEVRERISRGVLASDTLPQVLSGLEGAVRQHVQESVAYSLRPVINATGVILHTNLGRAPLSPEAVRHIAEVASGYSNLEFNLESGDRGRRDAHAERLAGLLLSRVAPPAGGAPAADWKTLVVNNCAAAVLIVLNTLAEGGEVIVSRGELVEIGGSFRIPEIMAKSGGVLREVGTTNRTRISDFERAINDKTRLLLRVHRSNFAIVGFTEQPALSDLVELGRKHKLPVFEDQGNGSPFDLKRDDGGVQEYGFADSLRQGVDIVSYSGDKLLGGPQAGLISGNAELLTRVRANPLFRALRADKLTYAALEATLAAHLRGGATVPVVKMLATKTSELRERAQALRTAILDGKLPRHAGTIEVVEGESLAGGGTAPGFTMPTCLLAVNIPGRSDHELQARLRQGDPPVIARVEDGRTLLDLRTVFPEQDGILCRALRAILEANA